MFAVARFVELADQVFEEARERAVPLVATGGTPLYYKSLFEGLFDGPGADDAIRARLNDEPLDALHARLTEVDPAAAARIHVNDRKRLVRALEVFELTGQPISSFQTAWTEGTMRHEAIWFGLDWDREAINRRINARTKQMIEQGWLAGPLQASLPIHPLQLYFAAAGLVIGVGALILYRRKRYDGEIALAAFPAAIIGGLGNPAGALVGSLLIGVTEAAAATYQNDLTILGSGLSLIAPYVVMVAVLIVRPMGLLGAKETSRV